MAEQNAPRVSDARDTGRRQRSRIACEPCRERKRKCDGGKPCSLCVSFDYECHYRTQPRRRKTDARRNSVSYARSASPQETAAAARDDASSTTGDAGLFVRTLESNSGSAFVRSFALAVDPANQSTPAFGGTLQMLAFNLYLGERQLTPALPLRSITDSLSIDDMRQLVDVYFDKVDPCYGFVERDRVEASLNERWLPQADATISVYDAVLCGIAAIACLYSNLKDLETEISLASFAKHLLDLVVYEPPSVESAIAWVLRTVYLRLTGRPSEAWMSSCTALHHVDAAGLHRESLNTVFQPKGRTCDLDTQRRIFGVARHLNAWLSFDLARSRVVLQNASYTLPTKRPPNDYTTELLELLPYTENLDPGKAISGDSLLQAMSEVLARTHTQPPSILAQCNLMLCLYRRLYTLKWKVPHDTLAQAVALIERGLAAVHMTIENGSPWHHVANVPFQSICTLLAIDTAQSFSLLGNAISCLDTVNQTYQTQATKDAVSAAYALTYMHQKRREADLRRQSDLLKLYPTTTQPLQEERFDNFPISQAFTDLPWFTELMPDIDLENFDQIFTAEAPII